VIHSFALRTANKRSRIRPAHQEADGDIDDDIAARSAEFLEKQVKAGKPVFLWVNFTHMHFRTHPKPESVGQSGRWMGLTLT